MFQKVNNDVARYKEQKTITKINFPEYILENLNRID